MDRPTSKVSNVGVTGPLAPYAAAFTARLGECGYTRLTQVNELRVMAHLSRWLQANQLRAGELSGERLGLFLAAQRLGGYGVPGTLRGLAPLLGVLRDLQVAPAAEPAPSVCGSDVLLASFRTYLLDERGLAPSTAAAYVQRACRFLAGRAGGATLADLTAAEVTDAVIAESTTVSVGSVQYFVAALRSFLRFCFITGRTPVDLAAAALSVSGRRQSSLPRGIDAASATAVLGSCDRRTAVGRRDYAVLVTLLRLGLRAGEVAGLVLEDIDWRAAQIVVHGKNRRVDRLPLPVDVGEAITGYLRRGRPATTGREVFVRALAPVTGLGRGAVSSIVRRACVRAGLPAVGAHRLRHTAACQMVAAGVPLTEIGQVLRHRSTSSTAIYARLDVEALRVLAQPWPGSVPR